MALERGKVFLNDVEASEGRGLAGDIRRHCSTVGSTGLAVGGAGRTFEAGGLQILYEDETLLVVNKPAGLLLP